jgi:hypothetical protein
LCDKFEEDFGDFYGYEGLDYNLRCRGTEELVFSKLRTEVVVKLCRRVVLLTSYNGNITVLHLLVFHIHCFRLIMFIVVMCRRHEVFCMHRLSYKVA